MDRPAGLPAGMPSPLGPQGFVGRSIADYTSEPSTEAPDSTVQEQTQQSTQAATAPTETAPATTDLPDATEDVEAELQVLEEYKDLPESVIRRFDGKDVKEILQSYAELETRFGKMGNELGDARKDAKSARENFDKLIQLQQKPDTTASTDGTTATSEATTPKDANKITTDDLYDNPEETISKVVERKTTERLEQIAQAQQAKQAYSVAVKQAHPDVDEVMKQPEFAEFVKSNTAVRALASAASEYSAESANLLLDHYKLSRGIETAPETVTNPTTVSASSTSIKDASLEAPSNPSTSPDARAKTYSRGEIVAMKSRAQQGDYKAQMWVQEHNGNIMRAYAEGRVTD